MQRRLVGTCLVLMAVLTVLFAARRDGVRVTGQGTAIPSVADPRAGDCVAALIGPAQPLLPLVFGIGPGMVGERSVLFSGCAEPHIGEVVAYRRITPSERDTAKLDSDGLWCSGIAAGYSKYWRFLVRGSARGWSPVAPFRFLAILSSPGADAVGRRWAACAVLAPGLERYQGSYVASLAHVGTPAPSSTPVR